MPGKSRRGKQRQADETAAELPPAPGDEQQEFTDSDRQRRQLDPVELTEAIRERSAMPRWDPAAPLIDHLDMTEVTGPVLVEAGHDSKATAKPAEVSRKQPLEITAAEVRLSEDTTAATLVLPLPRQRAKEFDPRSMILVRETDDGYIEVHHQQLDVDRGLLAARVTDTGRYTVLGLPAGAADLRPDTGDTASATGADTGAGAGAELLPGWFFASALIYRLVWRRVFDAAGPWRSLGPVNLSCCIMDLAIDPANPDRLYAGASDGGIWRLDAVSAYPAATWQPVTDHQPNLLVQCLAVSAADSQVVYYVDRTGLLRRSRDRGTTWTTPSSTNVGYARRLLADPTDANRVYVATSTGLWSSHDGGATWRHNPGQTTLHDGDLLDAVMDPTAVHTLYIGQRNVGVRKSTDGGQTWRTVLAWSAATAPQGSAITLAIGHGGIAPSPANRTLVAKLDQEVFVNRHSGETNRFTGGPWTSRGQVGGTGYGDWCHVVAVDPFDDDHIFAGAQQLYRSDDGGANWTLAIDYYRPHEDQHRVVFDPVRQGVVYAANDGGVFRSTDGGATWMVDATDVTARRDLNAGLVTAQFYTAAFSGEHAVGNLYHQGIAGASSLRLGRWEGIEGHGWEFQRVYGDPTRAGVYYVLNGPLWRRTYPSGALATISTFTPTAVAVDGFGGLLAAANDGSMWRTTDPTDATPAWTVMPGGPAAGDTVAAIAVSPTSSGRAYALTGFGRVLVCPDTQTAGWTAVTPLPAGGGVAITVDRADPAVVFAATGGTVYRSANSGTNWTRVHGHGATQLPAVPQLQSLIAGPGSLYAAGAGGVYTSPDRGASWYSYSDGLPNVEIKELLWTDQDLFAVTHGRGVWHHGRYDAFPLIRLEHELSPQWLLELWLAIHGGDPAPDVLTSVIGSTPAPFRRIETPRG